MGKKTAAKQTQRTREPADPAAKLPKGSVAPTREWIARYGDRVYSPTNSSGQKIGRAYLRRPWFESLIDRDWTEAHKEGRKPVFSIAHRKALELYRECAEASEASEVKSCLNVGNGRGSGRQAAVVVPDGILRARTSVKWMESLMGPLASTVRAVAIDDMSYAQVAMARFGSRNLDVFDAQSGAFTSRPAPRSGRHTKQIRDEFVEGVQRLAAAGRSTGAIDASGGTAAPAAVSTRPICDAIDVRLEAMPSAAGIAVSITVAEAIARENGEQFDHEADELDYRGLPVTVKRGWSEGAWMVVG